MKIKIKLYCQCFFRQYFNKTLLLLLTFTKNNYLNLLCQSSFISALLVLQKLPSKIASNSRIIKRTFTLPPHLITIQNNSSDLIVHIVQINLTSIHPSYD